MSIEPEVCFIKRVVPTELELRGYLYQCCLYTGKRSYLDISVMLDDAIESKGLDLDDFEKIPYDVIIELLKKFEMLPDYLFFYVNDQFAHYDSPDFAVTIEKAIQDEYKNLYVWDDDCGLDDDEDFPFGGKPAMPDPKEKEMLFRFLPRFYSSVQEVKLENDKFIIAYTVGNELIDLFTENGIKFALDRENIDFYPETDEIVSCTIALDKKSILLHFLSRMEECAIFELVNNSFQYKESGYRFFARNASTKYYLPDEIDLVIEKQISDQYLINSMQDSVKIGDFDWATRNLEITMFRNGDIIQEARSKDEWELASDNKIPAFCYFNNDPMNQKYGKLYNFYAVSDPRGLAPEGWRIASIEDWENLGHYLGDNHNRRLKGGEWQSDTDMGLQLSESNINEEGQNGLNNDTGFTALPGGARGQFGSTFFGLNDSAYWWTSSSLEEVSLEDQAFFVLLYEHDDNLQIGAYCDKKTGYSVRCI
jgi:uncharacterized protein (TIGR02145 family)